MLDYEPHVIGRHEFLKARLKQYDYENLKDMLERRKR